MDYLIIGNGYFPIITVNNSVWEIISQNYMGNKGEATADYLASLLKDSYVAGLSLVYQQLPRDNLISTAEWWSKIVSINATLKDYLFSSFIDTNKEASLTDYVAIAETQVTGGTPLWDAVSNITARVRYNNSLLSEKFRNRISITWKPTDVSTSYKDSRSITVTFIAQNESGDKFTILNFHTHDYQKNDPRTSTYSFSRYLGETNKLVHEHPISDLTNQSVYVGIISTDISTNPSIGTNPGGSTGTGGEGDWTLVQNPIPDTFPIVNSLSTGLFRVFGMTASDVQRLALKLWSPDFINVSSNFIQKLFNSNLMNVIAGLIELPFSIESCCGAEQTIKFDWLDWADWGTNVKGKPLTTEYYEFTYPVLNIARYSHMFFDFEPYSTVLIYLPYVGYRPLHATEILDCNLTLKVRVHITTGEGVYWLISDKVGTNPLYSGNGIIGQYPFNCARMMPLSQASYEKLYSTMFTMAGAVAGAGAQAVSGIYGDAASTSKSMWGSAMNGIKNVKSGGHYSGMVADVFGPDLGIDSLKTLASKQRDMAEDYAVKQKEWKAVSKNIKQITNGLSNAIAPAATDIMRSGNVSPVSGRLTVNVPYLIITHPELSQPLTGVDGQYAQYMLGWATNVSKPLVNFRGYTEIRFIDISNTTATDEEYGELMEVLHSGIHITGG